MANHIIALTTNEETLYQKYLVLSGYTEEQVTAYLKGVLTGRVLNDIKTRAAAKFDGLTPAQKIAFLES